MIPHDPVIVRELPVIRKIIADETWLEGERRGCVVAPDDRVVRERVCEIVLRIGQQLREEASATFTSARGREDVTPDSYTSDGSRFE